MRTPRLVLGLTALLSGALAAVPAAAERAPAHPPTPSFG